MANNTCPICGKKASGSSLPFCCERCRNLDLANWLDGKYAIPIHEPEPDEPDELKAE